MNKPIAIIPARGGSKRLPRKNILPLAGVPLLERVIMTCINSGVFDSVIVSTEDQEIASIAENSGAKVHLRSNNLAQDTSTVVQVCLDILENYTCCDFCCIYATSALLSEQTIQQSYKAFSGDLTANVLMGVSSYNYSPVQALVVDENGYAKMLLQDYEKTQSQFHPKFRVSNGSFYWARATSFNNEKTFYSASLKIYDVPPAEVCDLDTPEDYAILKEKFGELHGISIQSKNL